MEIVCIIKIVYTKLNIINRIIIQRKIIDKKYEFIQFIILI